MYAKQLGESEWPVQHDSETIQGQVQRQFSEFVFCMNRCWTRLNSDLPDLAEHILLGSNSVPSQFYGILGFNILYTSSHMNLAAD